MRSRLWGAAAAGAALAALVVPAANAGLISPSTPPSTPACQWPMFGHDPGRSFAQPDGCSSVTPSSAPTLAPKWYFPTEDAASASPAIVDGHLYIGDWAGNFYSFATDPPPGPVSPEWTFRVDDTSSVGFGRIVSSAAYAAVGDRKLVLFAGGATLYVLDASTGARLASACVDPRADVVRCQTPGDQVEILSSPAIVQEAGATFVVVGMDVHNARDVGRTGIIKFSLTTDGSGVHLDPVWKFDPEAHEAYSGDDMLTRGSGTGSGCGGVWGSPAVDVGANRVFFGTASCSVSTSPGPADTTGEHVWSIRLDTGAFEWTYGPHIGSLARYDDDFGGALNLLPGNRVGAGSKDGWYYAFSYEPDASGNPLEWKTQAGQPGHAQPSFAIGGILASPATGKVNGEDAVFVATAISTPNDKPLSNGPDTGAPSVTQDPQRMFSLHAIRVSDGAILWRAPASRQAYGPPTYVNGVVLVPSTFDFQIDAFDANTGLPLAARPLPGPPSSAPTAYGDSVYGGVGTSTEEGSPLAPVSGVYAFRVA